jgi:hypothetical protein
MRRSVLILAAITVAAVLFVRSEPAKRVGHLVAAAPSAEAEGPGLLQRLFGIGGGPAAPPAPLVRNGGGALSQAGQGSNRFVRPKPTSPEEPQ